jgi:hypothetical protein
VVRPAVVAIDERAPRWVAWPGRWGDSRAGLVPGEESSPHGPAFQPERWDDPAAFHEEQARTCGAGPPGRTWQTLLSIALLGLVLVLLVRAVLRRLRART